MLMTSWLPVLAVIFSFSPCSPISWPCRYPDVGQHTRQATAPASGSPRERRDGGLETEVAPDTVVSAPVPVIARALDFGPTESRFPALTGVLGPLQDRTVMRGDPCRVGPGGSRRRPRSRWTGTPFGRSRQ